MALRSLVNSCMAHFDGVGRDAGIQLFDCCAKAMRQDDFGRLFPGQVDESGPKFSW